MKPRRTVNAAERVKRGWEFDADVAKRFDGWVDRMGLQKNAAAQLAIWAVQLIEPRSRQTCMELLTRRENAGKVQLVLAPVQPEVEVDQMVRKAQATIVAGAKSAGGSSEGVT